MCIVATGGTLYMMNFWPFTNDSVGVLRTCLKLIPTINTLSLFIKMSYLKSTLWLLCGSFAVLCVVSSFIIIWLGNRELIASLFMFYECHVAAIVLKFVLVVQWVGLQYVIVSFPGYTDTFLFKIRKGHWSGIKRTKNNNWPRRPMAKWQLHS